MFKFRSFHVEIDFQGKKTRFQNMVYLYISYQKLGKSNFGAEIRLCKCKTLEDMYMIKCNLTQCN